SQDDVLFGMDDGFPCGSPDPIGFNDPYGHQPDHLGDDMSGMFVDNSLTDVPMDDYQPFPSAEMQNDSRDFQTLQPPVSSGYDLDMGHSQSSMGGMYSNGGTTESMLYEQTTTISNGDHHMMGGGEEHYGMPGTSFGSYQPSPMADQQQPQHSSPSVSRQQSRPASRTPAQKGGGGLVQHISTPSTSSNFSNSPAPLPVKTVQTKKRESHITKLNGSRKKNAQGANSVGAVLTKANKMAATTPAASSGGSLRLSAEDSAQVAKLCAEIETLQAQDNPHARARMQDLERQRAAIFMNALTSQVPTVAVKSTPSQPQQQARQRTAPKKQPPPSSDAYTPQCATVYMQDDGYAAVPGTSHGGYTMTPSAPPPMQQRYKVSGPPPQQPPRGGMGGAPPPHAPPPPQAIYLQQGQPPPQMVQMTSSPMVSTMTSTPTPSAPPAPTMMMGGGRRTGGGARSMMVRGPPQQQQLPVQQLQPPHPALQHVPPGTTVRAALKGGLQHLQQQHHSNNNNHQQLLQQQQQGQSHHLHPQQQPHQQHRASPMPSTSQQQPQPQPLLQLSLPVHQQQMQQPMRIDDTPFRPNPQLTQRRIEDKKLGRQRKLQTAFDIMSQQLLQPETELPFAGVDDVFRRLMPYHLLFEHDMDSQLEQEFDLQFMRSMVDADEKKKRLTERMRRIALTEAISKKDEECNLLLFLDAEYERNRLEEEQRMEIESPGSVNPIARATALALDRVRTPSTLPPKLKLLELEKHKPDGLVPLHQSFYEYHPFVERRCLPTPPPPGPLHGLEESEVEDDTEDEECAAAAAGAAGPSGTSGPSSAFIPPSAIKRSASTEDDDASPEMGCPIDDPPKPTVPHHHHRPTVCHKPVPDPSRVIKQEIASPQRPRPPAAAAAGKVQPVQRQIKQEVASPARNSSSRVTVARTNTVSRHEMPEASDPVPQEMRNRMMDNKTMQEDRRKKDAERERRAAEKREEERRKKEDERKEREKRRKEVEDEEKRKKDEEEREKRRKEEEERKKKEEREKREREEAEKKPIKLEEEHKPLKLKIKIGTTIAITPAAPPDVKKEEEEDEEEENRERKSKKKRKKEKRRGEEDEEEERE
ncbi:hypothetical protein PENTCL1PPCAC_18998, partial [Pristionchus entomophagus]